MHDERARRTHAVFVSALELDEPERDAFVVSNCAGDAALEAGVRRLLAAVPRSTRFLETPALGTCLLHGAAAGGEAIAPKQITIRGYCVQRVIGVGGMATVYEAEQERPRRIVALKVMGRALASSGAVRRFHYETEVLARLRHPGIAQIYEAGTCDDGAGRTLPYFAMELVVGAQTITQYARVRELSLRQRVALLADVCDAVQHGHQLGVIHRDLKPANILVDDAGRTKVIDFGVAKPTDSGQGDLTREAGVRQLVGTLTAMSPEQCRDGASVDVRADVYALGVVLYELVTGRLPLDLRHATLPEAVRMIEETLPARPSTFAPEARGDLDAIILMAIEKDASRRYATAAGLASDLRHYLNDEPIEARRPGVLEQCRRFARRNRALVGGVAAVFLTLVAGIAATTRMTYVAERARRAAEARERELEQVTAFQEAQLSGLDVRLMGERLKAALVARVEQATSADGAPADAERQQSDFRRLLESINFTTLAAHTLDENLLQRSYDAIRRQFVAQPLVQARLLHRLAGTLSALGLPERAEEVLADALHIRRAQLGADHPDTMQSLHGMGALTVTLGRYDEAVALLRDAYDRSARVNGPEHATTLGIGSTLGGALRLQGDLVGAEAVWRTMLETLRRVRGPDDASALRALNNMGIIYAVQGKLADAEAAWRELLDRRRRLAGADQREDVVSLGNLAMVLQDQGRPEEARPLLERCLAAERRDKGDDHPETLVSISNLASLLVETGELDEAERLYRECFERRLRTLGPSHPGTLAARAALASIWQQTGRAEAAESVLSAVLEAQEHLLGAEHPNIVDTRLSLGAAQMELGQFEAAEATAAAAAAVAARAHGERHWLVAHSRVQLGRALSARGAFDEAGAVLRDAYDALCVERGRGANVTRAAATALGEYFAVLDRLAPGEGHARRAAEWMSRAVAAP